MCPGMPLTMLLATAAGLEWGKTMSASRSMANADADADASFTSAAETARRWWWLYLVAGFLWLLYGMFVLSLRPTTLWSLAILAGLAFIFAGISQIMLGTRVESWRWAFYFVGFLSIAAGIVAFAWPGAT